MKIENFLAIIENHDAVMILLEANSGKILEANRAALRFYGYSKEEMRNLYTHDINILKPEECRNLLQLVTSKSQNRFTSSHRLKNGAVRRVEVYISPIPLDDSTVLYSIIFDITKQEESAREIRYLAYHDYLTGTYNRRFFDETFEEKLQSGEEYPLGVIMGDVNGLKLYNDTYGHAQGDQALVELVRRMEQHLPPWCVLARIGGDEFGIILTETNEEQIRACLDNLERELDAGSPDEMGVTISFGYGLQRNATDTLDMLLKEAEAFMYDRKYYSRRSARSSAVQVILQTLFAKSECEKPHSERVSCISEALAKTMQLDQEIVDKIRVAGLMHDIGKIGIEERILNKPGRLDQKEWEIMKLHSAKGANILENTREFHEIASWVLSHHERYDGTGYPNKIGGEDIPLASRIIAVADSYDAMTNERCYRKAMTKEEAIEELERVAGSQLDPQIVRLFNDEVIGTMNLQ